MHQSESPAKTTDLCVFTQANVLIIEVTAYTPWKIEERIKIRDEVKSYCPDCKIVILVDDQADNELAEKVKSAKRDGLIDAFLFGTVTEQYMAAVMDSL